MIRAQPNVDRELWRQVKIFAAKTGLTASEVVRRALGEYLKKHSKD